MKPKLLLIKNEFKTNRVLPEVKPKPLAPPVFEVDLVDMRNKNIKWYFALIKI